MSKLIACTEAWDGYIELSDEEHARAQRAMDDLGLSLPEAINVVLDVYARSPLEIALAALERLHYCLDCGAVVTYAGMHHPTECPSGLRRLEVVVVGEAERRAGQALLNADAIREPKR